jgi:hypothetical protein
MTYGNNEGFTAYHDARGTDTSDYDAPAITAARTVASEWLDARYRGNFTGLKIGGRAQVREWPRTGAIDYYGDAIPSETVPIEIDNAVYVLALRELSNPGTLATDVTPNEYKRVSVDGAVSVEFANFGSAIDAQTRFQAVDDILSNILAPSSSSLSGRANRA